MKPKIETVAETTPSKGTVIDLSHESKEADHDQG